MRMPERSLINVLPSTEGVAGKYIFETRKSNTLNLLIGIRTLN